VRRPGHGLSGRWRAHPLAERWASALQRGRRRGHGVKSGPARPVMGQQRFLAEFSWRVQRYGRRKLALKGHLRMILPRLIKLSSATLLLVGCVSVTEPVAVGPDTYMIGLGDMVGLSSDAELMARSVKAAGAYCAAKGRSIAVQSMAASGVQLLTPQSNQVVFKCLPIDAAKAP
jgi:hypothetical protein